MAEGDKEVDFWCWMRRLSKAWPRPSLILDRFHNEYGSSLQTSDTLAQREFCDLVQTSARRTPPDLFLMILSSDDYQHILTDKLLMQIICQAVTSKRCDIIEAILMARPDLDVNGEINENISEKPEMKNLAQSAIQADNLDVLKLFLKYAKSRLFGTYKTSVLAYAIYYNSPRCLEHILSREDVKVLVNTKDVIGLTPLLLAAHNNVAMIPRLLSEGADVNVKFAYNDQYCGVLHMLSCHSQPISEGYTYVDVAKTLTDAGLKTNELEYDAPILLEISSCVRFHNYSSTDRITKIVHDFYGESDCMPVTRSEPWTVFKGSDMRDCFHFLFTLVSDTDLQESFKRVHQLFWRTLRFMYDGNAGLKPAHVEESMPLLRCAADVICIIVSNSKQRAIRRHSSVDDVIFSEMYGELVHVLGRIYFTNRSLLGNEAFREVYVKSLQVVAGWLGYLAQVHLLNHLFSSSGRALATTILHLLRQDQDLYSPLLIACLLNLTTANGLQLIQLLRDAGAGEHGCERPEGSLYTYVDNLSQCISNLYLELSCKKVILMSLAWKDRMKIAKLPLPKKLQEYVLSYDVL